MLKLKTGIIELYKKVAFSLPPDVEDSLRAALETFAPGSNAREAVARYLDQVTRAREHKEPICVESGVPVFYVKAPVGLSQRDIKDAIKDATLEAVKKIPLAPGPLNLLASVGAPQPEYPVIYMEEAEGGALAIELLLKCPGGENYGRLYSLPDESIGAGCDLGGVAACVMDTVIRARGMGCPPYVVGVGVGGSRDTVTRLSKDQLRRRLHERNPNDELSAFEDTVLGRLNEALSTPEGPVKVLGVKAAVMDMTATGPCYADVTMSCWATRRGKLIW